MAKIEFETFSIQNDLLSLVMGIVNTSPESFFKDSVKTINSAMDLIEQGADILDIGGVSTKPGFLPITESEEINRVIPLIKEIRKYSDIPISIDSYNLNVITHALDQGANIINCVGNIYNDSKFLQILSSYNVPFVIMHGFMQNKEEKNLFGKDKIVTEVNKYFSEQIIFFTKNGISKKNIILDPGIGFGKSLEENITLIKDCSKLCKNNIPLLMAFSRKRCVGALTDTETQVTERLIPTVTTNIHCASKGAKILRVHDVKETIQSLKVMKNLM